MTSPLRSLILAGCATAVLLIAVAVHRAEKPTADDPGLPPLTPSAPQYWKGNLHTHSLWSDGDDFPDMIADWYKRKGYQFLALTEHNTLADGDKWVDAASNAVRQQAVAKYRARFGEGWVERREKD